MRRDERPWRSVPRVALLLMGAALTAQIALHSTIPRAVARAQDLSPPPTLRTLQMASLGEPLPAAKMMNLFLQAHDNQPGLSVPFRDLDYPMVIRWLARILEVDPRGQYPLLAASRLYGDIPDAGRQRLMLAFVHQQFLVDPDRRWAALAHAAHIARHRLHDMKLAREYARSLRENALGPNVPSWARQMEIFLLADMNQHESARILLGALLESGQVRDPAEYRFLASRLKEFEAPSTSPLP